MGDSTTYNASRPEYRSRDSNDPTNHGEIMQPDVLESDADFVRLRELWPSIPENVRRGIVAMAEGFAPASSKGEQ